jgi:hypothetical protein
VKPRDSSEEEHGLEGDLRGDASHFTVTPAATQGFVRSASGVVAAPASRADEDDEKTTVDPASLPMPDDQQAALARRIRHALGQTLPLGTPVPGAAGPWGARTPYTRTMLLGGRQSPGLLPSEPPAPVPLRSSERREIATRPDWSAASAPASPPPAPASVRAEQSFDPASAPDSSALRASFVRTVGLPTAPPPRRSRRPSSADDFEGATGDADHEAFALDRPLSVPPPLPGGAWQPGALSAPEALSPAAAPPVAAPAPPAAMSPPTAAVANAAPARADVEAVRSSVMLPPPPQAGDYEPASSPSPVPPAPRPPSSPSAAAGVERRAVARVPARPLLTELPSANPFEGFEAPRETFAQRFLIVFVVALAVVGMFALAAIAFGFLGKTTLW